MSTLSTKLRSPKLPSCVNSLSLPRFPFVRGEVMPATFSLPHLLVFSTLLCLVSSSSSLPPLLSSSHLSLHSPPISALSSLVSSCPALVTLPLSSVIGHPPSFLRVQPIVICSSPVSLSNSSALLFLWWWAGSFSQSEVLSYLYLPSSFKLFLSLFFSSSNWQRKVF